MTDKQLAVLLRQIAGRIKGLACEIGETITEGDRELEAVWIGEGPAPEGITLDFSKLHPSNWEWRRMGVFSACQLVLNLAHEMEEEADELARGDSGD